MSPGVTPGTPPNGAAQASIAMRELLAEVDREARSECEGLEALGKLPVGFTAEHYPMTAAERAELRRLKTALLLAEDPDTFLALCRGGKVPRAWYERRLRELLRA